MVIIQRCLFFLANCLAPNKINKFIDGVYDDKIRLILHEPAITYKNKDKYLAVYIICAKYIRLGHHLGDAVKNLIPNKYIMSKQALDYVSPKDA